MTIYKHYKKKGNIREDLVDLLLKIEDKLNDIKEKANTVKNNSHISEEYYPYIEKYLMRILKSMTATKEERIGEKYFTNQGQEMTIIEYNKNTHGCTVLIEDGVILKNLRYDFIKKGAVVNPLFITNRGIGYIGYVTKTDRKHPKYAYFLNIWTGLLARCYDSKGYISNVAYKDIFVCKEWHCFKNFLDWCFNNLQDFNEGWHLDKDILVKGGKIYSPNTCCFVPREINNLFISRRNRRGNLPIGVTIDKNSQKFIAQISTNKRHKYLGTFNTPEEAFQAYKIAKENYIKEVADEWKGQITDQVYEAMYNYEVEIND